MRLKEIFEKTISLWPKKIKISDGRLILETDGFRSENLNTAWARAEEKASGNSYLELGVWVLFKIAHRKAKLNFKVSKVIDLSGITFAEFEKVYRNEAGESDYKDIVKNISI